MAETLERSKWRSTLSALALVAVLALALGLRLTNLVPPARGLLYAADLDEGNYSTSARLALDGYLPYRDFFCSAPPVALYLFMAVLAPTSQTWGDANGFMALRYVALLYGMVTILAVYSTASRLGGRAAGLLSAVLLAMDGWAVAQDRRAMLEAPMNMFSALAILALVVAGQRQGRSLRLYAVSGIMAALAILSKTQGLVIIPALLLTLALQRRWRPLVCLGAAAAATYIVLSLPFLLSAGDDFVRQLIVFQFLRPANGDPALALRVTAIRNFPEAWLTVRLGLAGAALLLLRWLGSMLQAARRRERQMGPSTSTEGWLPVLLWAGMVAISFVFSRTFYLYYYVLLAPPLAMLGGSLLHAWRFGREETIARSNSGALSQRFRLSTLADPRIVIVMFLVVMAVWRAPTELLATVQGTRWIKSGYADAAQYLRSESPAGANILAFESNYTFLASRPKARLADGQFFVDTHAYMLYLNLGIKTQSWPDLLGQLVHRDTADEEAILWRQPAQDIVLSTNAQYIIFDRRARQLLSPQTMATLQARSDEVATYTDVVVSRMKRTDK